jgi:hypothetical protein
MNALSSGATGRVCQDWPALWPAGHAPAGARLHDRLALPHLAQDQLAIVGSGQSTDALRPAASAGPGTLGCGYGAR